MMLLARLAVRLHDRTSRGLPRSLLLHLRRVVLWGQRRLDALARRGRQRRPVRGAVFTRPALEGLERQIAASPPLGSMVAMALGGAAFASVALVAAVVPGQETSGPPAAAPNAAEGHPDPEEAAVLAGAPAVLEDVARALLQREEGAAPAGPVADPLAATPVLPRDPLPAEDGASPILPRNDPPPAGDGLADAAMSRAVSAAGAFSGSSAALAGSGTSPTAGAPAGGAAQPAGGNPSTAAASSASPAAGVSGIMSTAMAAAANAALPAATPQAAPAAAAAPAASARSASEGTMSLHNATTPAAPAAQATPPAQTTAPKGSAGDSTGAGADPTQPDPVQFATSTWNAKNGCGQVLIMVTRSGDPSGTVSVQYATSDGTAHAGTDYASTSGTLTFPPNTLSETFNVDVYNNTLAGQSYPKTVNLTLSNPVNTTLGSPSTATLTINAGTGGSTPTITNPGNQTSHENDTVSLQIGASDSAGDLYFGATGLPAGLTINSTTGLISGTLAYTDAETQGGTYTVTATAYDGGNSSSASTTFTWTVLDTTPAPVLPNPGNQVNSEGDAVSLVMGASAPDGLPLTYSATGLPAGLSLNTSTGVISGVIAANAGGSSPYNVTVTATDADGSTSQSFTWTVSHVQINGIVDQSNLLGDSVNLPMYAWTTSGNALTYSATGLPPGLSINSSTGVISGTVSNAASLTTPYSVTVTAGDGTDSASTSFNWSIAALAVVDPGDQTNAEGDVVALPMSTSDNAINPVITWSATGLPSGLAINPNTGVIAGTIANLDANNSPYAVTVTASDGTHTASDSFTWYVTHILLTAPATQYSAAGSAASLQVQASDPDNDTLTYSASGLPSGLSINSTTGLISGTIAGNAGSETPYAVTVTAADAAHSTSATFSWYVGNNGISVTNPGTQNNAEGANVSLPISASDPNGESMAFSASGLPGGLSIDPNTGVISGTVAQGNANGGGAYSVTVYADDLNGNQGSTSFTWNISHTNTAPVVTNPGDQVDDQGDVVSLPVAAYDPDGDTISYSATGLPAGLTIDSSSGVISGTVTASAGTYAATVTASDGTLTGSQSFHWVVDANVVTLTNPGDRTNKEGDAVSLQLAATDANNSTLTYAISGLPTGLTLNTSTGLISGSVSTGDSSGGDNGWYAVTATATDTQGYSAVQQFGWQITASPPAPVVTNPGTQINKQGDVVSLPVQASDPNGLTLTYSATNLPSGLSINSTTGVISGIIANNAAASSPYAASVTVSDGTYQTTANFTWDVTNQAVTITNPGTQTGTGGTAASLQINATDPNGYSLTYSAVGLPGGLSINPTTGLISGTIATTAGGQYPVTVMAADTHGSSGSATFAWNVSYSNQVPVLANPGDQSDNTGDVVSLQLDASDVDGDPVTYSASGLPSGLSLNTTTGLISGTLTATASGSPYAVTVTASDGTYNTSQTFNWYVAKDVVTVTNPGDQTNAEGNTVSLPVSASDANNSTLSYSATGLPGGLSINSTTGLISGTVATGDAASGPYAVTVTATDTQGYAASQSFSWTINPASDLPVITSPGNQSNTEGDNVSLQVQATSPLGLPLTYAASGLPAGLSIDPISGLISGTVNYADAEVAGGSYTVVLSADDGEGHTASQTFSWTIANKDQAPWLSYPGLQVNKVSTSASLQLQAEDPEGVPLTYSASGLPAGLSINGTTGLISGSPTTAGTYTVTASVSDGVLNSSQTFTWDVTTGTSPVAILTINGSPNDWDHVDLLDPPEPLPLQVTLQGAGLGLTQVQISIPSGRSEVNQSTLELPNGGTANLVLTPLLASLAVDDVVVQALVANAVVGNAVADNADVVLDTKVVTDSDTPQAMVDAGKYRVPPGARTTEIKVTLKEQVPPNSAFVLLKGQDKPDNGSAELEGDRGWFQAIELPGGYKGDITLNLRGVTQTKPGNAGNLQVVVEESGKQVDQSEGFSVAAIPVGITMKLKRPFVSDKYRAVVFSVIPASDSTSIQDLGKVNIIEAIQNTDKTGTLKDLPDIVQTKPLPANDPNLIDTNGTLISAITADGGNASPLQVVLFSDERTGARNVMISKSGFAMTLQVVKGETVKQPGIPWVLVLKKEGAAVTVKSGGNTCEPAAGSMNKFQGWFNPAPRHYTPFQLP